MNFLSRFVNNNKISYALCIIGIIAIVGLSIAPIFDFGQGFMMVASSFGLVLFGLGVSYRDYYAVSSLENDLTAKRIERNIITDLPIPYRTRIKLLKMSTWGYSFWLLMLHVGIILSAITSIHISSFYFITIGICLLACSFADSICMHYLRKQHMFIVEHDVRSDY